MLGVALSRPGLLLRAGLSVGSGMRMTSGLGGLLAAVMAARGIGYLFGKPPANPYLLIGDNEVKPGRERLAGLVFLLGTISFAMFGLYLVLTPEASYWIVLVVVPALLLVPAVVEVDWSRRRRNSS